MTGKIERGIEGRDRGHNADREPHQKTHLAGARGRCIQRYMLTLDANGLFSGQQNSFLRSRHLRFCVADRLAGFPGHDFRNERDALAKEIASSPQQGGPLVRRHRCHDVLAAHGSRQCSVKIRVRRPRSARDRHISEGIADFIGLAGLPPNATNQHRNFEGRSIVHRGAADD